MHFKDLAETYSEYNLTVIPCSGKRPVIKDWSKYCSTLADDSETQKWIIEHGQSSIGLPLGTANKLIGVDFDYAWPEDPEKQMMLEKQGITIVEFEKERREIESKIKAILPNSPCIKVGKPGKWTAFFRPNGIAKSFSVDRRGIRVFDVLYEGRQTILPPSIHPDTKKPYEWLGQDLISSLELLPELTLQNLEKFGDQISLQNKTDTTEKITTGRNDLLKKAAWGFFARGLKPEAVATHILQLDQDKNSPPLFSDKKEFPRITPEQAAKKFTDSIYKSFLQASQTPAPNKSEVIDHGFYDEHFKKDGSSYFKPNYNKMAEWCFEEKNVCYDDTISLKFDGKKWAWMTKISLYNFIMNKNKEHIQPYHLDNFVKAIKGKCFTEALGIKDPAGFINVDNGVIDVKSGELLPHSHEYMFKYCAPVVFDEKAECPTWSAFLLEVFRGNIELIDLAQRLFGYVLIGGHPFLHRAFVLYGNGRNGKSTFLDVLRAVIGRDAYSTVSMAKLDKEFSLVNIDGKLANIVEETPNDEINAEIFKTLVGGGEVQAAHKGFDEYTFRCNARFVFACNDMPVFRDKSTGLEERLVFMPFDRYFEEHERDTKMTEKLLSELSGILNWALQGVRVITKDPQIPNYEILKKSKETYRVETQPLWAWYYDEISLTQNGDEVLVGDLYTRYVKDMADRGNRPYSKDKFIKAFRKIIEQECKKLGIFYDAKLRDKRSGDYPTFNVFCFKNRKHPEACQFELPGKKPYYID